MAGRAPLTEADLATRAGRARAWRRLLFDDHHALRLVYANAREIDPGRMWRSAQPSPHDLTAWSKRGIRTIINLRGASPAAHYLLEKEACARLGLKLVDFRVYSREAPSRDTLHDARALFERIEYPALMHCKSGADRAGVMATLYRFFVMGEPFDAAMGQLSWRYGHVRQGKTGVIDYAFDGFVQHARREGLSLSSVDEFFDWADRLYDPAAAKKEFLATWWGSLLTEKILRRE